MVNSIISAFEVLAGGVLRQTSLESRMDQGEIAQHIEDAELRYVKPILGDTFYNNLVSTKLTDSCNYNEDKGALIYKYANTQSVDTKEYLFKKYLYKLCALAVYHQALPFIGVKSTNQGVMLNTTEFAQNVGFEGIRFLQQQIMDNISARQAELTKYLEAKKDIFDQYGYGADADGCEENKPYTNTTGIIFY
jgi:hypothetical protein